MTALAVGGLVSPMSISQPKCVAGVKRATINEQLAVLANEVEHIDQRLGDGKANFAMLENKIENVASEVAALQKSTDLKLNSLSAQITAQTALITQFIKSSPKRDFFDVIKANKAIFMALFLVIMGFGAAVLFAFQLGFLKPEDVKNWRP